MLYFVIEQKKKTTEEQKNLREYKTETFFPFVFFFSVPISIVAFFVAHFEGRAAGEDGGHVEPARNLRCHRTLLRELILA